MSVFPVRMLLATDGSADAALAGRAAADISGATGSELHVVHARMKPQPGTYRFMLVEEYLGRERVLGEQVLDGQTGEVEEAGGKVAESHLRFGERPADEILAAAAELGAGLILLGSRGLGAVKRLVLGSVSEEVVHHARCPVLVLRGGREAWPPARVIIGDDDSEAAVAAGLLAAEIGRTVDAKATVVRAFPELPQVDEGWRALNPRNVEDESRRQQQLLESRAESLEPVLGVRPRIRLGVGEPARVVLETAEHEPSPQAALVAVGSRGLGPLGRMRFGSVSTRLVRAAEGPVLIHPAREEPETEE